MQWAADMTAAYAVMNLQHLMTRREDVGWGFLRFYWSRKFELEQDPLRNYYLGVRDDRAELGTNIHGHIEADLGLTTYPPILSEEVRQMLDAWEDFHSQHEITAHNTEFTVVNDSKRYAGTADGDWSILCTHDGPPCLTGSDLLPVRTLVDLKSSRFTWREHGLQIAALEDCERLMVRVPEGTEGAQRAEKTEAGEKVVSFWLEEDLPQFEACALIHIRPKDVDAEGYAIGQFCKIKQVRNLELHRKGFAGALALAESEHELKQIRKSEGIDWEGI